MSSSQQPTASANGAASSSTHTWSCSLALSSPGLDNSALTTPWPCPLPGTQRSPTPRRLQRAEPGWPLAGPGGAALFTHGHLGPAAPEECGKCYGHILQGGRAQASGKTQWLLMNVDSVQPLAGMPACEQPRVRTEAVSRWQGDGMSPVLLLAPACPPAGGTKGGRGGCSGHGSPFHSPAAQSPPGLTCTVTHSAPSSTGCCL